MSIAMAGLTPDARRSSQHVVLLVDDEYLVRGVLTEILRDAGFFVIAVASAQEAIIYLVKLVHIDVVFSDIKMPGMDGFELAKWMHENTPDIGIILASGYTGKTNTAAELGGAEFIRKPFDFDHIVGKIREVATRPRRLNS